MSSSINNLICAFLLILTAGSSSTLAQSADSHVHGNAELNIVLMGQQLQVEFVSPAINLLGFERPPITDEESAAMDDTINQLRHGGWLIEGIPTACQLSTEEFEAPVYEEHESSEHDHEHESSEHDHQHESSEHDAEAHSNFRVRYLYDCDTAPRRQLKILAFDHYSGIETLTVQWIADQKQGYARLNRDDPVLDFE
ncbi:MAG: hypothetical protein CMQ16_07875 [Gammaproteobacteria bacterium]|nr:hypothetical protein [Gammaproteobacteria bacterium]